MSRFALTRLGFGVAACLALAGCGKAPVRPATDAPTFVSLNPCIDAILVEVAEPEQVLALSHYSRDPAASSMETAHAATFGVTGGTAEEVIALHPDVVLASSFIDPATRSALERAGMRVETFGSPASVEESLAQVRELAALTRHGDKGEKLAAAITATPQQPAGEGGLALLWQPGQIVGGEASLVAENLRWAGFGNYAGAHGMGQADHITLEQVLADPPQLLLVAGDSAGQQHPLMRGQLAATHIARFEPNLFYCAGPSIIAARERLVEIRAEMEGRP